jgi:mycoredoxin
MTVTYQKEKILMTDNNEIQFFSTRWCPDCFRAKRILDQRKVAYKYIDINTDADGCAQVEKINKGNRSVPTIVFPDGDVLVEPSNTALKKKLDSLEGK